MDAPGALVVAGFHRSGTSLTARRLQAAGFPLGAHLLPPHPSNPEGHFEDSTVVAFDDAWLARQGTDWLFHDEVPLAPDPALRADLVAYAASRDAGGATWAVKDPRLCLALPAWSAALGERGRFVVVVRHWAECVQSLLHRHSREMLFGPLPASHAHYRFWREPYVAYRAWLATSRRLLGFAATHGDRTVVATTRAIAGLPSLDPLLARLGLTAPHAEGGGTVRDELLQRRTHEALLPPPTPALRAALDATWEQLLVLADWRTGDEAVAWDRRRAPAYVRAAVDARVAAAGEAALPAPPVPDAAAVALRRDVEAAAARLALLPPARQTPIALADARRVLQQGDTDGAERLLRAALARTTVPHPLWLLLGDVEAARGRWDDAVAAYRTSHELKASGHAAMKLARALVAGGRRDEAIETLDGLLRAAPDRVDARLLRAQALEHVAGPEAALLSLEDAPDDPEVKALEAQLLLATAPLDGLRRYEARVRERLAGADLVGWLTDASQRAASADAWRGFVEAIWRHGSRLLGERSFATRLGAEALPDVDRFPADRPIAAIASPQGLLAAAAADALRAAGWRIEPGEHPGFTAAFAGLAAPGDPDGADVHAARARFLQRAVDDEDTASLDAWGWQHADTARFADALLPVLPGLRIAWVHAGAAPALAGWPLAGHLPGDDGDASRDALAVWLDAWRHARDLQARWPGRFALVDLRHPEAARIAWRVLFDDGAGPPPPLPAALAGVGVASLAGLDPRDVATLQGHGLL